MYINWVKEKKRKKKIDTLLPALKDAKNLKSCIGNTMIKQEGAN